MRPVVVVVVVVVFGHVNERETRTACRVVETCGKGKRRERERLLSVCGTLVLLPFSAYRLGLAVYVVLARDLCRIVCCKH